MRARACIGGEHVRVVSIVGVRKSGRAENGSASRGVFFFVGFVETSCFKNEKNSRLPAEHRPAPVVYTSQRCRRTSTADGYTLLVSPDNGGSTVSCSSRHEKKRVYVYTQQKKKGAFLNLFFILLD